MDKLAHLRTTISVCLFISLAQVSAADDAWLTGAKREAAAARPVSAAWDGTPLREALAALGKAHKIAIVLDRRIDPGQPVKMQLEAPSLQDGFRAIADKFNVGIGWIGDCAYFGPRDTAQALPAIAAVQRGRAQKAPAAIRSKLLKRAAMHWDDLARPRGLADELAREANLKIADEGAIPHDLWAGASTPPMFLYERLLLIGIQFDRTFEIEKEGAVRWTPLPSPSEFAAQRPSGEISSRRTPSSRTVRVGEPRYTMTVRDAPLDQVLRTIQARLKLEWNADAETLRALGADPQQRISFDVKEATRDALLDAVLAPAGLKADKSGERYELQRRGTGVSPVK